MIYLAQLTEEDYEKMAQEIQDISESHNEESLLTIIGNALHDSGLTVSDSPTFEVLRPKAFDENVEKFSLKKSMKFVADPDPLSGDDAKEEGKKFWQRFKDKLKSAICNDSKIKELLKGDGSLKDYLLVGLPLVLSALGLGSLSPLGNCCNCIRSYSQGRF